MAKASDNIYPLIRLAPGAAPATPAAGQQVLYIDSADGKPKLKDSSGTVAAIGGGGGAVPTVTAVRTAGDITFTADATRRAFDTGGSLDVTIAAAVGDVIELAPNMLMMAQVGGSPAHINIDASTRVAGADVNKVQGAAASGPMGWFAPGPALYSIGAPFLYTVQSADLSGGNVTFRLYYKNDNGGAGSARGVYASAGNPAVFQAKNLKH